MNVQGYLLYNQATLERHNRVIAVCRVCHLGVVRDTDIPGLGEWLATHGYFDPKNNGLRWKSVYSRDFETLYAQFLVDVTNDPGVVCLFEHQDWHRHKARFIQKTLEKRLPNP